MPDKWELVLELADNEGPDERVCYYYFVNCSNRSLFWLHEFDVAPFLHNLPQVEPKSNQRIRKSESPHRLFPLVTLDNRTGVGDLLLVSFHQKHPSYKDLPPPGVTGKCSLTTEKSRKGS